MSTRKACSKILFESPSIISGEETEIKKGDFEFEKKLGDGAFGHVWKVRHRITKEIYALKQVAKEKVVKMQNQFKREVYIMYNLNHPHVAKLFNHFEDDKSFYLIMEFAEGGNLFHRLHKQKHFMECEAAQYFREVLLAVDYLHSHVPAIIHRDIKPENILLDKDGRVKLTDFGWSNYYCEDEDPRMTICGTPEYLPPEMVEQRTHDTSADIWCLGVLLYEMLVGHTPFKSQAKKNMLMNISMCKPKFPLSFPPLARDLISRMLIKSTVERLKIKDIQEHPWLVSIPEMKETKRQRYCQIPLPQYHESIPVNFKCYKVIGEVKKELIKDCGETKSSNNTTDRRSGKNSSSVSNFTLSDSELTLSDSEESKELLEEIACRDSIRLLVGNIEEKQTEIKNSRNMIRDIDKEIRDALDLSRIYERKISEKQEELLGVKSQESTLVSKITDLNVELEQLFIFADTELYSKKIQEMQTKHIENLGIFGVYKKTVENLKEKIKENERVSFEKMKELKALSDQINFLKGQRSIKVSPRAFYISEQSGEFLNISHADYSQLSAKVRESVQGARIEQDEFQIRLKTSMAELQAKNTMFEAKIGKLKRDFDEKKRSLLLEAKQKKEKIHADLKSRTESLFNNNYEACKALKNEMREKLIEFREIEHKYPTTNTDLEKVFQKFLVIFIQTLKNLRVKIYFNIKKERTNHFDLREKKRKKQLQLNKLKQELSSQKVSVNSN